MEFLEPLFGGALIGIGSLIAMAASGKIPGISGVASKILKWHRGDTLWRILYLAGLVVGAGLAISFSMGWAKYSVPADKGLAVFAVAGLLVGFGSRMGGGCTSGHGVCGIGAGAKDAIIYTLVFMAAGILTVFVWNQLMVGGALQ